MLAYDKKLADEGFFVTRYEDRFFWDTPENLAVYPYGTKDGWRKYEGNPVLGGEYGTCFDLSVLMEGDVFKMWFSWRPHECIAYSESRDGILWTPPVEVLRPNPESEWDGDELNRPSVILRDGVYEMWYSGQMKPYTNEGRSCIGYARSRDGIHWERIWSGMSFGIWKGNMSGRGPFYAEDDKIGYGSMESCFDFTGYGVHKRPSSASNLSLYGAAEPGGDCNHVGAGWKQPESYAESAGCPAVSGD